MSAYAQTLDILNSMFEEEDELMTFQEIRKRFSKMNFDKEAKAACENVLERYQTLKRELLNDRNTETSMLPEPITTEVENYYPADVLDIYQVSPAEFIDVKALMGDTADNIPGVPSVGEKTATKLIVEYGSVENIYENIEEVKPPRIKNLLIEHKDIAVLSKELATINIDSPIDIDIESADINTMFNSDAYSYMKRLEFKSLLKRFEITDIEQNHNEIEEHFKIIDDLGEAENIFKKALSATTIGIYPVWS